MTANEPKHENSVGADQRSGEGGEVVGNAAHSHPNSSSQMENLRPAGISRQQHLCPPSLGPPHQRIRIAGTDGGGMVSQQPQLLPLGLNSPYEHDPYDDDELDDEEVGGSGRERKN